MNMFLKLLTHGQNEKDSFFFKLWNVCSTDPIKKTNNSMWLFDYK